ncbi:MAG: hypothetical protein KGL11_12210 [Alphaproteobacteria bacterium]|nr:hypothetical protein [Alphaproteobacteria bacterium]
MTENCLSDHQQDTEWDNLLQEAAEGKITMSELMCRALPFFSFGDELAAKRRYKSAEKDLPSF